MKAERAVLHGRSSASASAITAGQITTLGWPHRRSHVIEIQQMADRAIGNAAASAETGRPVLQIVAVLQIVVLPGPLKLSA
jgi:hypothetical protein